MNAIDRLCTIATDVSLEATTLAADVRDELANMRSAIGKALADMKDVDEPCDGGSWCFVHDDHVPLDSEHCHTHQGHLRLQALISSALPSPSVERVQAPAGEASGDAPPQAGPEVKGCGARDMDVSTGRAVACLLGRAHLGPHKWVYADALTRYADALTRSATTTER